MMIGWLVAARLLLLLLGCWLRRHYDNAPAITAIAANAASGKSYPPISTPRPAVQDTHPLLLIVYSATTLPQVVGSAPPAPVGTRKRARAPPPSQAVPLHAAHARHRRRRYRRCCRLARRPLLHSQSCHTAGGRCAGALRAAAAAARQGRRHGAAAAGARRQAGVGRRRRHTRIMYVLLLLLPAGRTIHLYRLPNAHTPTPHLCSPICKVTTVAQLALAVVVRLWRQAQIQRHLRRRGRRGGARGEQAWRRRR